MSTIDLTADSFAAMIEAHSIVLVDFWAEWCAPCRAFAPRFTEASDKHPEIVFGKVDTDREQQLAAMAGIRSIPTLMAFRDQILVFSQPGALSGPQLEEVITAVAALDMQHVRAQISDAGSGGVGTISTSELAALPGEPTIVDVREPDEFADAHVSGAVNIPLGQLPGRLHEVPTDQPVYVMCLSGGRSARASALLAEEGRQAVDVAGGISDWRGAGLPLAKGA